MYMSKNHQGKQPAVVGDLALTYLLAACTCQHRIMTVKDTYWVVF